MVESLVSGCFAEMVECGWRKIRAWVRDLRAGRQPNRVSALARESCGLETRGICRYRVSKESVRKGSAVLEENRAQ